MSMFIERGLVRDVIACVATSYGKSLALEQLLPLVRSCLSKRIVINDCSPSYVTRKRAAGQKITPIPVGCTESRTAIVLFLSDSDVLLGTDECRSSLQTLLLSHFIGTRSGGIDTNRQRQEH